MDFYEVLEHVLALLQRHGRVSYRALKRQFNLDDEVLDDLKEELLYAHPVVDDEGRGLVWTGNPAPYEPDIQRRVDKESRFHALLPLVIKLIQQEGRITYRTLKHALAIDDSLLEEIHNELIFRQIARDEQGEGLVCLPITETRGPFNRPTVPPETISTDTLQDEPAAPSEPTRTVPEAERRQLTVMFCDLADSTGLSQQLDPEDLREVVRAYQATAAEVVQRYEGHMAQYLGDGLLIYFGWPTAHEDDAQRALHAGLGIVEAMTTALNPRLKRDKGVQLTVRLGIHTGPVVVGEMGAGGRQENLATGETVNIAARLEGLAPPNTMVISSVTERLVHNAFALDDLGPQMLKGVAEPMQTFRVLGPMEDDEDETAASGIPFLVGRDEEVGLLLRRWEQSKEGLGQVVLIRGEAGIGKSSLVATLRSQVAQEGHTRMAVRCSPYHTNSALYPLIEHVQRVLQFQPGDIPSIRLDKLERGLDGYSRPLEEVIPLYAALLSIPLPEGHYTPLNLSPQQQRQQTQDALVGWLLEEAERQPTLAMWEDLHWADPSTLEILGLVLEQTPTVPMLHVLTFRPEFEPPWPNRSHMTPITLNRLERAQVEALIAYLAGGKTLPAEVVQHIIDKTDGVPLYIEELTKMLLDSNLLREESDQYVLTGPLSGVSIPDTLQDSLMARLDRMKTAKEVAQLGAVLGREFAYEVIQAIWSQDEETLQAGLTQLVEAELLYQRGRPPRSSYIFKHALIQDAAYASLLRSTRQQVHQQIVPLLETRFPDLVDTQPELLAHHCMEAGQDEAAINYWQMAGQRAIQGSAYIEAIAHLTQGLDLLTTLPATSARLQQELDLQIALGPALIANKGYTVPDVERVYTRARELCERAGDSPQLFSVMRGLMTHYQLKGQLLTANQLGEQLLSLAQSRPKPVHLLLAHYQLGAVLFFRGELARAQKHLTRALANHNPQEQRDLALRYDLDIGVGTYGWLSWALWQLGYPDQALQHCQAALSLVQEVSHPYSLTVVHYWAAVLHQFRHEATVVHEQAAALTSLATEHEFAALLPWGQVLQGWSLTMQGQKENGIAKLRQGLDSDLAIGSKSFQPHFLALLAEAYGEDGHPEKGLNALTEALTVMEDTEARFYGAELYRLKGELLLQQTVPDRFQAESCFHQALDIARQQQAKSWELCAATSLARLWQSQGKRQDAYDLLAPMYGWFAEGFDTADLKNARTLLDELG